MDVETMNELTDMWLNAFYLMNELSEPRWFK